MTTIATKTRTITIDLTLVDAVNITRYGVRFYGSNAGTLAIDNESDSLMEHIREVCARRLYLASQGFIDVYLNLNKLRFIEIGREGKDVWFCFSQTSIICLNENRMQDAEQLARVLTPTITLTTTSTKYIIPIRHVVAAVPSIDGYDVIIRGKPYIYTGEISSADIKTLVTEREKTNYLESDDAYVEAPSVVFAEKSGNTTVVQVTGYHRPFPTSCPFKTSRQNNQ